MNRWNKINSNSVIVKFISAMLFLIIWQIISLQYLAIIFPSPIEVLEGFFHLFTSKEFYWDVSITIFRGMMGFGISMFLGTGIAVFLFNCCRLREIFYPYILILQSIPRISWMLIAMIWFPFNSLLVIFILVITLFPMVTIHVLDGFQHIDGTLLDMARIFRVSFRNIFLKIYFPSIMQYIISSAKATMGVMWKTVIMAELLTVQSGLGAKMGYFRTVMETEQIIAVTVVIVVMNIVCQKILEKVEQRMFKWRNKNEWSSIQRN